jgi:hypothetical protein
MKKGRSYSILEGADPEAIIASGKEQGLAYVASSSDPAIIAALFARLQSTADRKAAQKEAK